MQPSAGWFDIKMPSYQYRKSHCRDKPVIKPSYLHNGISYTGKTASLYWIEALVKTTQLLQSIQHLPLLTYYSPKTLTWHVNCSWLISRRRAIPSLISFKRRRFSSEENRKNIWEVLFDKITYNILRIRDKLSCFVASLCIKECWHSLGKI